MTISNRVMFVAVLALALMVAATDGKAKSGGLWRWPVIESVEVDTDESLIFVRGHDLHNRRDPKAVLGGIKLELFERDDDGEEVVYLLPDIGDGSYLLTLHNRRGFTSLSVAIGAVAVIPDGTFTPGSGLSLDSGALSLDYGNLTTPDNIRIETAGNRIEIVAGTSKITVTPGGSVKIESAGSITLESDTTLTLKASDIEIDAANQLSLKGVTIKTEAVTTATHKAAISNFEGTTNVNINSGGAVNIGAAGTVKIDGSTVDIDGGAVDVDGGLITLN